MSEAPIQQQNQTPDDMVTPNRRMLLRALAVLAAGVALPPSAQARHQPNTLESKVSEKPFDITLWKELFNTTETASKSLEDWVLRVQEVFHNSMLRGASNVALHLAGSTDTIQPNAQVMHQMKRAISLYNTRADIMSGGSAQFGLMTKNPADTQRVQAEFKEFIALVNSLEKLDPRTREFAIFGLLNDRAQDAPAMRASIHGGARYLSLIDLHLSDTEYDVAEKTLDDFRRYYGSFANASHNAHNHVQTLPTDTHFESLDQEVFNTVDSILRTSDELFTDGNRDKDNWGYTLAVEVRLRPYGHVAKRMRTLTEKIQFIDRSAAANRNNARSRDDLLLQYELMVKQLLDTTPAPPVAPRIALV